MHESASKLELGIQVGNIVSAILLLLSFAATWLLWRKKKVKKDFIYAAVAAFSLSAIYTTYECIKSMYFEIAAIFPATAFIPVTLFVCFIILLPVCWGIILAWKNSFDSKSDATN